MSASHKLNCSFSFLTGLLLLAVFLNGCSSAQRPGSETVSIQAYRGQGDSASESAKRRPTALELEARLMGFADRYLSKAAEATDTYQHLVRTKAARELGLATFIFPGLTVIGIAAGGEPGSDLLDMVVFATLQRESLEKGWAREILGDKADNLIKTQQQLETQIWEIAGDVLSLDQLERLRAAIRLWRKVNPNQRYVSNVKFDDVATERGAGQGAKGLQDESVGLLAPLDAAVREGEEIRLMARRSMYIIQRMPPLLMAQARFVLHEEVSPEQVDGLLKDVSGFRVTLDEAQKTLARMPASIGKEREALFNDLDKLSPVLDKSHTLTQDVRDALETFRQIEVQYPASGAVINETLRQYRELAEVMDRSPPSDMRPKIELLHEMAHIGEELNHLASFIRSEDQKKLKDFWGDLLNALLFRAMALAIFVFGLVLLYRRIIKSPHGGAAP
ncbi:MAG: hypothetical protein RLZZ627_1554 [Pseudomonadota bacterium]